MTRAEVLVNLGREDELDGDGLRRLGGVDHQVNLEVDLLFFDTTSTYFERDEPDGAGEGGEPAFRAYGHSKDHRPELPQVVIGLAVTRDGIPVRVCVAGQHQRMSVLKEVKDDLRGWRLGRVVTVVDRGFSSDENLRYLTRAGGHWIAGEKMRDAALTPRPRSRAKAAIRPSATTCASRKSASATVMAPSASSSATTRPRPNATSRRARTRSPASRPSLTASQPRAPRPPAPRPTALITAPNAALRDHPALGRYLRQTTTGRLRIDRAKITAEARLDGKYLLSTSDPDLSAEDVALGYKNLLEAERGFRDLKTTLELRPVFHRLDRAHILICWLALLLIRISERQTGLDPGGAWTLFA
ncbi:MAG: IS1634 family transposase [Solirubrobacteraceae bacterium]